jgi:hypothetical protein
MVLYHEHGVLDSWAKHFVSMLYGKLPQQDQLAVKAVSNAQKARNASTQNVTAEFQKLTGTQNSESWLTEKLLEAEKFGLI